MGVLFSLECNVIGRAVLQRTTNDCGVAALATATCETYEAVAGAMQRAGVRFHWTGLSLVALEKIALQLGWELMREKARRWSVADHANAVIVTYRKDSRGVRWGHYVAQRGQLILDTDGSVYHAEAYAEWARVTLGSRLSLARHLTP